MRAVLYSHDGLGLGHVRRNLAIAAALKAAAHDASVVLATGWSELPEHWLPAGVDTVKLPAFRKLGNDEYGARHLTLSRDEVRAMRSSLLESLVQTFHPDVILVDKHPLGVRGELRSALAVLRKQGGRAVLGLRDVLDDPATVCEEWDRHGVPRMVLEHYDRVLVFGHPLILDPIPDCKEAAAIRDRLAFCGYVRATELLEGVSEPHGARRSDPARPLVLATAGGGEDGFGLLETFIAAAARASWEGLVVTGPQCSPPHRAALRQRAHAAGVRVFRFAEDLTRWFETVDALVCMGGYNTLVEAVSRGTPTVCIPREHPRREQFIRARAFADLELLRTIDPHQLSVAQLRSAIEATLATPRNELRPRAWNKLDFRGAERAAAELIELSRPSVAAA